MAIAKVKCPHCNRELPMLDIAKQLPDEIIASERGRRNAAKRKDRRPPRGKGTNKEDYP